MFGKGWLGEPAHVASNSHGHIPVRDCQLLLHVLGHIYQHRARPTSSRQVEGFLDYAWEVVQVHHQVVVLGNLPGDLHYGRFLESIGTDQLPGYLWKS